MVEVPVGMALFLLVYVIAGRVILPPEKRKRR
jgi:hypothetical protein